MDLREIQRLHAQFTPDSMTIDLPRQIAALPAPANLTADTRTPTIKVRLPKALPVARRSLVAVAIAAVVAMAGMGAASLYKSVGATSSHDVKKTVAQTQSDQNEPAATEGLPVVAATRPIDAEPPHPVALPPTLKGKDVAPAASIGLTADQFKSSLGTTNEASAAATKATPAVSNDDQRAAASPIHQARRETEPASQAPTNPAASVTPAQPAAQPSTEEHALQQNAAPTRAHSYRHRSHSRDEQVNDGDTASAINKKSAFANRAGANEVQMF